jgi:hypothetical protein
MKSIDLTPEVAVFLAQARAEVATSQLRLETALRAIAISNGISSGQVSLDESGTKLLVAEAAQS